MNRMIVNRGIVRLKLPTISSFQSRAKPNLPISVLLQFRRPLVYRGRLVRRGRVRAVALPPPPPPSAYVPPHIDGGAFLAIWLLIFRITRAHLMNVWPRLRMQNHVAAAAAADAGVFKICSVCFYESRERARSQLRLCECEHEYELFRHLFTPTDRPTDLPTICTEDEERLDTQLHSFFFSHLLVNFRFCVYSLMIRKYKRRVIAGLRYLR